MSCRELCMLRFARRSYSKTKSVCKKWNGTQRHEDTEFFNESLQTLM